MPKYKKGDEVFHEALKRNVRIEKHTGSSPGYEYYNVKVRSRKGKGIMQDANFSFKI